jgi:DNA polymerase-4
MKSISQEITYDKDTNDAEQLRQTLRALSQKVGFRLRQKKVVGKVVRIKMRWADFSTFTRQISLPQPTDQDGVIFDTVQKLFLENWDREQLIRLIGVGVSSLEEDSHQLSLFDTPNEKEHRLLTALDEIHEKYGKQSLTSADVMNRKPIKKSASDAKHG